jgi:MtN3 and saliva related transmembrane protein
MGNIVTIIGILASIFTGVSLLPQLVKLIKEKKAENVSFMMLLVLFVGLSFWVTYGILKNDYIIIVSNSFSLLVNLMTCILTLKYK